MFQVSCVDSEMILKKSFALLSLIYFLVEKPEIHFKDSMLLQLKCQLIQTSNKAAFIYLRILHF
jgi:hypothetical protein